MGRSRGVFLFCLVVGSVCTGALWADPVLFQGHYYQLTSSAKTWQGAQAEAESVNGNLVWIDSYEEQIFLERTFLVGPFVFRPVWIGLIDVGSEGDFYWYDLNNPQSVRFRYFTAGEPNDAIFPGETGEDYVAMNWGFSVGLEEALPGDWNDTPVGGTPPGYFPPASDGP